MKIAILFLLVTLGLSFTLPSMKVTVETVDDSENLVKETDDSFGNFCEFCSLLGLCEIRPACGPCPQCS